MARRRGRPLHGRTLATPLSSFVGRAAAMEELAQSVKAGRLVTLTGAGGVGKSRLALEVAADLSRHGDPVALVELGSLSDPGTVLPAVATALGVPGNTHDRRLSEHVVHAVGENGLLLVLDGCEHLRHRCAEVVLELLGACHGLRILASSRERLDIAGEVVWTVPSLSLPEVGPPRLPEAVVSSEAVQLFCDRAAALQRGFVPTPDNIEAIVEICRRLDGNPLAIELAAGRIVALPPTEIAGRLDDRFSLLRGGPCTAPLRHQTLRASMEWDYVRLSVPERTLLSRLSVFPRGFGVPAAEGVCAGDDVDSGQVLELLRALVDKSLVVNESTASAARFRLSETVRSYALERLQEVGGTQAVAERHAAWCLALQEAEHLKAAGLLTPAEVRVATLAAQGLANAVIARELVLSRRTVETHLQRAYAKLGISSRKQLAPFLRSREEMST